MQKLIIWRYLIAYAENLYFKNTTVSLLGAALVIRHFVLDLVSGHPHYIFGAASQTIGLGNYATNPFLAVGIEAVFTVGVLWYYFGQEAKNGIQRTSKNKASIIGLFVFGILFMLILDVDRTN